MSIFKSRRLNTQKRLAGENIDGLIVFSPENLFYLTGFGNSYSPACAILSANGNISLVVAEDESFAGNDLDVIRYPNNTLERPIIAIDEMSKAVRKILEKNSWPHERFALEGARIPSSLLTALKRFDLVNMSKFFDEMRCLKDMFEIAKIREAVALVDFAHQFAAQQIRPGLSEIELFSATRMAIEAYTAQPTTFQCDLLSGDRTLLMGGLPGGRRIGENDMVIMDFQISKEYYWADTARTVLGSKPSDKIKHIYDVVGGALERAMDVIKPDVPACEVDRVAREYIAGCGYGGNFPHHTGHGCGLCYCEPPLIVPNNAELLVEGMVLCLEPAIYVAGIGGVRLEQMVLVTAGRPEVLSQSPLL
jgi:Xaa-Pro aminopeptidase